jgi:hypothetical protein
MISSVLASARKLAHTAIVLIVATLAALLVLAVKADAAAVPSHAATTYVYDGFARTSSPVDITNTRGSPAAHDQDTAYDSVDHMSRGALTRPGVAVHLASYTYNDLARLAEVAQVTVAPQEPAQGDDGWLSARAPSDAAAKNGVPLGPGVTTRKINWRPNAADPNWGLTGTHVNKHLFGNSKYALNKIDPGGNADIWRGYMQDPASRPATGTTSNRMLDIVGTFPRTGGSGSFQFGIRLAPGSDGSFDLITLLTQQ